MENFYIASCVFTEEYPQLSKKIQKYIAEKNLPIIRCCVANWKVKEHEDKMPDWYRDDWKKIPHYKKFPAGSTMVSLCHNCAAIFEERHPEIFCQSFWELILEDENFNYPNYGGEKITVQDCWRSKENLAEQKAVREILRRMNFEIVELKENFFKTKFCGYSLYQPQPLRNAKLAPKRFVENAKGFFEKHTQEEKEILMKNYCEQIQTEKVIAYCHYCVRGLRLGGKKNFSSCRTFILKNYFGRKIFVEVFFFLQKFFVTMKKILRR